MIKVIYSELRSAEPRSVGPRLAPPPSLKPTFVFLPTVWLGSLRVTTPLESWRLM